MPAAALHHAVDLGALLGKRAEAGSVVVDTALGQWAFFAAVALFIGGGGALLYGVPTVAALALGTAAIAGTLAIARQARRISPLEVTSQAQVAR